MPKMKSHAGTKKRLKRTGTGKLLRASTFHNHLMSHKSPKQNRQARRKETVGTSDLKRIRHQVPYL
ncbi:MAG TPA: 50S ribosomal protein L35 [Bacillota bacterium]|nr:50S ribosomal protein L35 [Bacillota bacterium]HPF42385.1 50S ribosomal protein L35 [Bacillota bacterium]HPJ85402.1 50S ribosomal protein L35 [Bacillota bacterium]HPQ61302.1 50S ribosomal protein L35 [Bacillota bacterium]HRX91934.1 50S ribosomal protein L35 [Candidatus Izemoplasmatales bacterium]